jgi:hypothetical protein
MSKSGKRLIAAAKEAVAIARGEKSLQASRRDRVLASRHCIDGLRWLAINDPLGRAPRFRALNPDATLQLQFRPADGRCFTGADKVGDMIGERPACSEFLFAGAPRLRGHGKHRQRGDRCDRIS